MTRVDESIAPDASTGGSATTAFRRAARAEWVRLWTVVASWWALLVTAGLLALVTVTAVAEPTGDGSPIPVTVAGQLGIAVAQFGLLLIVLLAVTGEFSTGAVRTSLQWVPRRGVVVAARTTVTVAVVTVLGVLLVLATDLVVWLATRGDATVAPMTLTELATSLGAVAVVMAGSALLTAGLGFALRHPAGTLTAVFALLFLLPATMGDSGSPWLRAIADHLPGSAVVSLLDVVALMGDGRAAVVLLAWGTAAVALGAWTFLRRDL